MHQIEPLTIQAGNLTLHALASGPKDGEPTLALHGWLDNAETFWRLRKLFPTHWRVVAVDMPGHGLSEHKPAGTSYPFTDWIIDVHQIMEALAWEKARLIGHSMGAGICGLFAGTFPDRVDSFIAIEGIAPLSAPPSEAPDRLAKYVAESVKKPRKPPARYNSLEDATAVRAMAGQFHDAAMIKPMVERNLEKTGDTYSWRTDPRLRKPSALRMSEDQIDAFLQKITAPTLLIKAEKGLIVAAETSEKLKSLIPNLAMESLPGFHHLHLDTPEAVAKVILNWIDSKT